MSVLTRTATTAARLVRDAAPAKRYRWWHAAAVGLAANAASAAPAGYNGDLRLIATLVSRLRQRLHVSSTGSALSIPRRQSGGTWAVVRDANLLSVAS